MELSRETIAQIYVTGRKVAEKMGMSCIGYDINEIGREVIYKCNGFGEVIYEAVSFEELKEKYNIVL